MHLKLKEVMNILLLLKIYKKILTVAIKETNSVLNTTTLPWMLEKCEKCREQVRVKYNVVKSLWNLMGNEKKSTLNQ